jgi:pimeloyl-ACP methyl ester carboxylesterase
MLVLVSVLLACGAVTAVVYAVLLGESLLKPPRMTGQRAMALLGRTSPGDLGFDYEETRFDVEDAATGAPLALAGWWIPSDHPSDTCVVLVHGFADSKAGALAWSGVFRDAGVHQLLIDLRAHGMSGGQLTTGGWFEGEDLRQVAGQIPAQFPQESRKIVIFGASLGAAAAVRAALLGANVKAVITDSLFASYTRATQAHAELLGLPRGIVRRLAILYARLRTGATFTGPAEPLNILPKLSVPVLQIQGELDPFTPLAEADQLALAPVHPLSRCLRIPHAHHLQGLAVDRERYQTAVLEFLELVTGPRHPGLPRAED